MRLLDIQSMALHALGKNKVQTALTMLGIVIGVSAVIALTNIGEGATAKVSQDIGKLGNNLLIINPGAGRHSASFTPAPGFTQDDVEAIPGIVVRVGRDLDARMREAVARV